MSVTGMVTRRLMWRVAQAKMADEYRRWADSGQSIGSYVERRLPAASTIVAQAEYEQLTGVIERVRAALSGDPARDAEQARERAHQLDEAASAADDLVDALRRRRDELAGRSVELGELEQDAEERASTIIAQAEGEADERLGRARHELEALERRIELHVADVRFRARAAAETAVHRARREYDEAVAFANAELERARFAAREASEAAEAARHRAAEFDAQARQADEDARSAGKASGERDGKRSSDSAGRVRHLVPVRNGSMNDLDELSRDALYDMARDLDVPGRSKMSRGELLTAVRRAATA